MNISLLRRYSIRFLTFIQSTKLCTLQGILHLWDDLTHGRTLIRLYQWSASQTRYWPLGHLPWEMEPRCHLHTSH